MEREPTSAAEEALKDKLPVGVELNLPLPEGPPQCHIPLETLSSIPTIRLNDLDEESQVDEKETELLKNLPVPCVIVCSRKRFLQLAREKRSNGEQILDKLTLVVFDDVHEALRDEKVKAQLFEILTLIRFIFELTIFNNLN